MTKKETELKERIDKIIRNGNIKISQLDALYDIYNTREVISYLGGRQVPKFSINEGFDSLEDNLKPLLRNLIILFNNQPEIKNKGEIKMENTEITFVAPDQEAQPKVEEQKAKIVRAKKRDKSFYEPIIKEIDELKTSGKHVSEIMTMLTAKYPEVKASTLMAKYFEAKRNEKKVEA